MVAAFGLTLLFAGLVTNLVVSLIGLLCATVAAIGWCFDVFPHPQHEAVSIKPPEEQPTPIRVAGRSLAYLPPEEDRRLVPTHTHTYSSGILGGLAGGVAMAVVALTYGFLQGSIWYPINLLAAAGLPGLGASSQEVLMQFHLLACCVALIIHISCSILVGLLYVVLLPMLPARFEWLWGGIVTPLLWTALLSTSIHAIDPALGRYISWPWFIVSQLAYGLVGGFVVYKSAKVRTMQVWSMREKMGVEGMKKQ
ncbi:MAG: hypothetical protein C5B47_07580 [Verrucomicrobia bacterium]|nr:MAG: hypothetical protein C5B47_07580 [Verrucomicrobiota bacterium]